jgi:hypothetical protein
VLYRSLLALPFVLQFIVQRAERPVFALMLLGVAVLISVGTAWEWWRGTCERLVLTDDTVELYQGRRRQPRARLVRANVWASRFVLYRPEADAGPQALAISDGSSGVLLDHAGWMPRYTELLTIIGIPAPWVSPKVATRRHPEAFGWSVRHPVASTVLTLAALATVVLTLVLM